MLFRFLVLSLVTLGVASAAGTLFVKPVQVCNNSGTTCANSSRTLFEAETDKIWAQAGLDISFLSWSTLKNTSLLTVNTVGEQNTLLALGAASYVTLYFVKTISFCGVALSGTVFGCAATPGYGLMIGDAVFTYGRRDTIAHELGHILGLPHPGDNAADNLMTDGNYRTTPTVIGDITPTGAGLGKLTPAQISTALSSPLVSTPEPATGLLMAFAGLGGLLYSRFRRTRA